MSREIPYRDLVTFTRNAWEATAACGDFQSATRFQKLYEWLVFEYPEGKEFKFDAKMIGL